MSFVTRPGLSTTRLDRDGRGSTAGSETAPRSPWPTGRPLGERAISRELEGDSVRLIAVSTLVQQVRVVVESLLSMR